MHNCSKLLLKKEICGIDYIMGPEGAILKILTLLLTYSRGKKDKDPYNISTMEMGSL